ncbi:MAG: hypothetical protein PWP51_238 [Clostridiales bacterium]|jgi:HAD superfamily hydrolase (TIGR01458 family)|nr:hypothetical protein [Clostridiales bacterium]MDN5297685.1 hypothetical protein [Clostridiales bacterium]
MMSETAVMKSGIILDLDGTLMDGVHAYEGAVSLVNYLQSLAVPILVMTNSVQPPEAIMKRLQKCGMDITAENILNPIVAMNAYIRNQGWSAVRCIGGEDEQRQLLNVSDTDTPDAVALLDFEDINADYRLLQTLMTLLRRGVPFLAASGSCHYTKNGVRQIDTGAFVRLLELASNCEIQVMGKPSPLYFQMAYQLLGKAPEAIYVIGDDVITDMHGAAVSGSVGCLIKTGKYQSGDEDSSDVSYCFENLEDLKRLIEKRVAF